MGRTSEVGCLTTGAFAGALAALALLGALSTLGAGHSGKAWLCPISGLMNLVSSTMDAPPTVMCEWPSHIHMAEELEGEMPT